MFKTRIAALLMAFSAATLPVTAWSAIEPRGEQSVIRAWSAVAGLSARQVIDLAATLPAGVSDAGTPWCDATSEIAGALGAEFGERLVLSKQGGHGGLHLWGSAEMGTWTMLLTRADQTSCVVASGTGYHDSTDPAAIFRQAGLN